MQIVQCKVEKIEALTDTVTRVLLHPESQLTFKAGQYLQVVMGESDKRPFSIANAPREDGAIELHIGAEPGNQYAGEVLEKMRTSKVIDVEGGLGDAYLRNGQDRPTILLAGGTGFSYTYSILQQMLSQPVNSPLFLFWGTRTIADMYAFDELNALAEQYEHFTFVPVVENADENWQGKTGWVHQAVLSDFNSLADWQVYVAGRFEMAKVVREDFSKLHLESNSLFGDAYAFI